MVGVDNLYVLRNSRGWSVLEIHHSTWRRGRIPFRREISEFSAFSLFSLISLLGLRVGFDSDHNISCFTLAVYTEINQVTQSAERVTSQKWAQECRTRNEHTPLLA